MRPSLTFESNALNLLLCIFYSMVEIESGIQCIFLDLMAKALMKAKTFMYHFLEESLYYFSRVFNLWWQTTLFKTFCITHVETVGLPTIRWWFVSCKTVGLPTVRWWRFSVTLTFLFFISTFSKIWCRCYIVVDVVDDDIKDDNIEGFGGSCENN